MVPAVPVTDAAPWFGVPLEVLRLLVAWLAAWEAIGRVGGGPVRWLRPRLAGPLVTAGLTYLAGFAILGVAWLGLALTGLFYPACLLGLLGVLALASRSGWRESPVLAFARAARAAPLWLVGAGATLLAPVALHGLLPEIEQDFYLYHMGVSATYLAMHKAALTHIPYSMQTPMPMDLVFGLARFVGDDRLVKWLTLTAFLSACAVFGQRLRKPATPAVLVLGGAALALSVAMVPSFLENGKNDLPAAALLIAGAAFWLDRQWSVGALLLGAAAAGKFVFGPFIAIWFLVVTPPLRKFPRLVLLASLAPLPWLVKSWLVTGNPIAPFASGVIPTFGWDARNQAVFLADAGGLWLRDTMTLTGLPAAWVKHLVIISPAVAALTAGLLLLPASRRLLLACVLGQLATLFLGHFERYLLPAVWLVCLEGSLLLGALRPGLRRLAIGVLTLGAVGAVWRHGVAAVDQPWRDAFLPLEQARASELSTLWEMSRGLGGSGRKRILSVGECATYMIPGRVVYGGFLGETPVVWQSVAESADEAALRRKFRQLGCRRWLYNYVSAMWMQKYYGTAFPWNDRMIRLYSRFCRTWLDLDRDFGRCDYVFGGYVAYSLRAVPLPVPARAVMFLPGAEAVTAAAERLRYARQYAASATLLGDVVRRYPEVLEWRSELALVESRLEHWDRTYALLRPVVAFGGMDSVSGPNYGLAASYLGKNDEAIEVLTRVEPQYPAARTTIHLGLAAALHGKAMELVKTGRVMPILALLDRAQPLVATPFPGATPDEEGSRVHRLAYLYGLRGDVLKAMGRTVEAARFYQLAYDTSPTLAGAGIWLNCAKELSSGTR